MFWIGALAGCGACVVLVVALVFLWLWKHRNDNWINF